MASCMHLFGTLSLLIFYHHHQQCLSAVRHHSFKHFLGEMAASLSQGQYLHGSMTISLRLWMLLCWTSSGYVFYCIKCSRHTICFFHYERIWPQIFMNLSPNHFHWTQPSVISSSSYVKGEMSIHLLVYKWAS